MNIFHKIEELRAELTEQGIKWGFQDAQVLRISKMLDELINEYFTLTEEIIHEKAAS